ncbi:hypothetical protein [Roseovarius sp. Pro17]|uniref:hypothetical protein n=1 Tax=Roseovarius sp. Pro17 TaxID=3108175 RepID=UPI002D77C07C|nr:hypothetical protein [Roseovarius sp. Pro17]
MTDSISPGADGQANHTLAVMRDETREGALAVDVDFLPGLAFHADPALEISGSFASPKGRILDFDAHMGPGLGEWVGLHVALPAGDLRQAGILGFAARVSAPEIMVVRACLRSGTINGFVDCFFDKHLMVRPEEASHLDALPVQYRDQIPMQAPWRELVLFLPTHDFRMSLIDLRTFIV